MKTFKKHLSLWCIILLSFVCLASAHAEEPDQMLRRVTSSVMEELKNGSGSTSVIQRIILPHIDFNEMARWVVGRNAWKEANEATRQEFISEFRSLLVRTYTRSLQEYANQNIEFHKSHNKGADRVQVSSTISGSDGKEIRMDYLLIRSGGGWKVYDVLIEGVSIIQGYRSQFAETVEANGVQGAIDSMRNKNDS
jgi:phospholipid transport system substrate-binding protein